MHVCLTGPKTCPPDIGGIEVFAFELAKRLESRGVRVSVVCHKRSDQKTAENLEGVEVYRIPSLENRYMMKLSMMPGILKRIRDLDPTILHANDATSGFLAVTQSRIPKTVVTIHGIGFSKDDWPFPFRQGIRYFQLAAVRRAGRVVATDAVTAAQIASYRADTSIIPAGVDIDLFNRKRHQKPEVMAPDRTNMIFVGRLTKVKGIDLLMEGLSTLDERIKSTLRLIVIGDGPMAGCVTRGAGGSLDVKWLCELKHDQVAAYFAHADLFVLPSRSEGFPIAILEAMSSQTPVVCTMVGGIRPFLNDSYVTPIKSVTPAGVGEAISSVLNDQRDARTKALRAREFVEKEFSWDRIAARYMDLYEGLLA